MNFKECYAKCKEFGFNEETTAEQCWNQAYLLGRKRWYWGPNWWVTCQGWFNTQVSKFKSNGIRQP